MKTLIVDDEPVARKVLREELEQIDNIVVAGEAEDRATALAAILGSRPDLVFLDLQMPGLGGFDVLRRLRTNGHMPVIVVVTAWDQYAIQAFEIRRGRLLKPVMPDRLSQAVERAAKVCGSPAVTAEQLANLQEIAENVHVRPTRRIADLVWIVTAKKRYLATQTLKVLQEKLRNTSFRRIRRNALVNTDHIRKMSTLTSQRWLVTLSNNQEFIVSKRQASTVRGLLTF
jgi:DNA-binding LytR/AlgR family response regulator